MRMASGKAAKQSKKRRNRKRSKQQERKPAKANLKQKTEN